MLQRLLTLLSLYRQLFEAQSGWNEIQHAMNFHFQLISSSYYPTNVLRIELLYACPFWPFTAPETCMAHPVHEYYRSIVSHTAWYNLMYRAQLRISFPVRSILYNALEGWDSSLSIA